MRKNGFIFKFKIIKVLLHDKIGVFNKFLKISTELLLLISGGFIIRFPFSDAFLLIFLKFFFQIFSIYAKSELFGLFGDSIGKEVFIVFFDIFVSFFQKFEFAVQVCQMIVLLSLALKILIDQTQFFSDFIELKLSFFVHSLLFQFFLV